MDELISDVLRRTPSHGRASVERPRRTYICTDTRWSLEDLPEAMDDRDRGRERERELGKFERVARHDDIQNMCMCVVWPNLIQCCEKSRCYGNRKHFRTSQIPLVDYTTSSLYFFHFLFLSHFLYVTFLYFTLCFFFLFHFFFPSNL